MEKERYLSFYYYFISTEEVMFSPESTCSSVGLSAGLNKNYRVDFHKTNVAGWWVSAQNGPDNLWCGSRWRDGSWNFWTLSLISRTFINEYKRGLLGLGGGLRSTECCWSFTTLTLFILSYFYIIHYSISITYFIAHILLITIINKWYIFS